MTPLKAATSEQKTSTFKSPFKVVEKSFSSEYLLRKGFVEFCSLENSLFHTAENCNKVIVSKLYSGERDVMKHFIKKKLCEEFQYGQSAKRCLVAESAKINLFGLAIKIYLCLNRNCEYYLFKMLNHCLNMFLTFSICKSN